MNRLIRFLCVFLVISVFFVSDGHAFWGKKKASKQKPKAQKEQVEKEPIVIEEKKVEKETLPEKTEVKTEEPEKMPAPKPVVKKGKSKKELKEIKKKKMMAKKRREQLNNTEWKVDVKVIGEKTKAQQESLVFEDNRFYSERSSKKGFNATNYTLSIKDDETIVWETMQTAEEGRINFWRGEISPDMTSMKGIVSKKLSDGSSVNYSFTSLNKKAIK